MINTIDKDKFPTFFLNALSGKAEKRSLTRVNAKTALPFIFFFYARLSRHVAQTTRAYIRAL